MARVDLKGRIFGRLTVVGLSTRNDFGRAFWICRCKCGNESTIMGGSLLAGKTQSCGCFKKERLTNFIHGMTYTPTHNSWRCMMDRCYNKNSNRFENYGGRGIIVCDRWKDFINFLNDMGERPKGKTLDRFPNVNGNYEPSNCRWATPFEQTINRRGMVLYEYNGRQIPMSHLCKEIGAYPSSFKSILKREGLDKAVEYYLNKYKSGKPQTK